MEVKNKIACVFNYAPHYRHSIYHLMAKEFGCDFFFGKNLPNGENLKKMDVEHLPGFKKESRVIKFRYIWQCGVLRQVFRGYQIYILTGTTSLSNVVFMCFAKLLRKKVFLWGHGLKKLKTGRHPLVRFFFQNATGHFLYGNFGKTMMVKYGIPENRLFVINNSLDYDSQLKVRNQLAPSDLFVDKFNNRDPVIIFTGRLLKNKKIAMILDAQKRLLPHCPFNVVLVGDGPERACLEQKANQLGVADRVWLYGSCYDEENLGRMFYNATLTVSPGNVGLTAIHSMMYGTPVLTHNNFSHQMPEYEAVKEEQTGLFFNEDDLLDMTEKIKHWINQSQDRDGIRKKCFAVIDNYFNPYYQINVMKQAFESL